MPRKPSYDFERREREKAKAAKLADKAKAKSEKKMGHEGSAGETLDDEHGVGAGAVGPAEEA